MRVCNYLCVTQKQYTMIINNSQKNKLKENLFKFDKKKQTENE